MALSPGVVPLSRMEVPDAPPLSTPPPVTPCLSVVLVNYRCWPDTLALVRRLRRSPGFAGGLAEVVIVDNGSPRHPGVTRLRRCPGIALRRWGRNRGFGRAANEGCRLSRGRWLLLLNPDTSVPPAFVEDVLARAERWQRDVPRAGIIGFQVSHGDGTRQRSTGPSPSLASTLARLVLPRAWRKYHLRCPRRRRQVPWVSGCCLLVRRDCFEQLGGFDRDFFLYYEDVDLCRRARAAGWSVWYDPEVSLVHHRPLHLRRVPALTRLLTRHALLTYAARAWPEWQRRLLAWIVGLEASVRAALARRRGARHQAAVHAQLRALAADLGRGRSQTAWRRLERAVRREEERLARATVDRDPQPQPPRPAGCVPGERPPARAAEHGSAGC